MPDLVSGSHTYSLAPLPKCVHDRGLPNLRVLASSYQESMAVLGELCPRLTHVHVPFTKRCSFSTMNHTSLGRRDVGDYRGLRVVPSRTWPGARIAVLAADLPHDD
jgi:hypothetical protein